jgi:hypothetical protein
VIACKGEVSLIDAAAINSAMRWERHALLAQRWLRKDWEELTADQRLNFSREVARASSERDKCLKTLGLEKSKEGADPLAALYGKVIDAGPQPGDGSDGKVRRPTLKTGKRENPREK